MWACRWQWNLPSPRFAAAQVLRCTGVIGFDINIKRLEELRQGVDSTNETSAEEIAGRTAAGIYERSSSAGGSRCVRGHGAHADRYVQAPRSDAVGEGQRLCGSCLKQRCSTSTPVVIYESTVYPGATEEVCVPILSENRTCCEWRVLLRLQP